MPQRRLGGTAGNRLGCRGVQAILEDVEVETAEILGAEGLQGLDDAMEFVLVVVGAAAGLQFAGQREGVAVDLQPLLDRQHVGCGIEV